MKIPHKMAPAVFIYHIGVDASEKMASGSLKQNLSPPSQVNGWDMTMVTHDKARKKLTKKNEDVVRLLVTRRSLEEVVKQSMGQWHK